MHSSVSQLATCRPRPSELRANADRVARSPTTLLWRTTARRHGAAPTPDAKETLLDHLRLPGVSGRRKGAVHKNFYRILRGGGPTPSPARKRRRSAGAVREATKRAARQDTPGSGPGAPSSGNEKVVRTWALLTLRFGDISPSSLTRKPCELSKRRLNKDRASVLWLQTTVLFWASRATLTCDAIVIDSRQPPRHRRDICSMACGDRTPFQTSNFDDRGSRPAVSQNDGNDGLVDGLRCYSTTELLGDGQPQPH